MTLLKYLFLLILPLLLLGSPLRAEDFNSMSNVIKNKEDTNRAIIKNIKSAPPKGSTGPTVPPNQVGNTMAGPKLGGSTGPTVPPKPVGTQK